MAIGPSGRFDYVAEFTSPSFASDEIVLPARSRLESECQVLLGHVPKVRFWSDRVVIVAADSTLAAMKWISFPVGDVVFLVAKAGDLLRMVRTATGDLGLSIVRKDELVVALGAVTEVNLGHTVIASNGFESLQVSIASHVITLRSRESINEAGGEGARYDVYLERARASGLPGVAECASIIRAGKPKATNEAVRGAVLLANRCRDTLTGEFWDGRYLRA
jgi:hypothetical protein